MSSPASARPAATYSSIWSNGTTTWRAAGWNSLSARYAVVSSPGTATSRLLAPSAARGSAGRAGGAPPPRPQPGPPPPPRGGARQGSPPEGWGGGGEAAPPPPPPRGPRG